MKIYSDVLVIGGGPAGLSAALEASKRGSKVILVEKNFEIGYPIHTSGGSFAGELLDLGLPKRFMHPIHKMTFMSKNYKTSFEYEMFEGCVLDVRNFLQYFAEQASKYGAKILVSTSAEAPIYEKGFVKGSIVRMHNEHYEIYSKVVIDASGINSIIARKCNLIENVDVFGVGSEYEIYAPNWNQNEVLFILDSNVAPYGYGWVFPRGNNRIRVGVGIINAKHKVFSLPYLEKLVKTKNKYNSAFEGGSEIEFHQGVIPIRNIPKKTVSNGLIVVGDAAGQILATTGEGIRFALDIGRIAGEVADIAVKSNKFDASVLSKYEQRWRNKYERKFKIALMINNFIRNYTDDDWDRSIELLKEIDPITFLEFLKGNFQTKELLRIFRKNPLLSKNILLSLIFGRRGKV